MASSHTNENSNNNENTELKNDNENTSNGSISTNELLNNNLTSDKQTSSNFGGSSIEINDNNFRIKVRRKSESSSLKNEVVPRRSPAKLAVIKKPLLAFFKKANNQCSTLPSTTGGKSTNNYNFNTLNVKTLENNNYFAANSSTTLSASKTPQPSTSKPRNRASYHQDVEEALNSLLWQPYEYQNKQNNNDLDNAASPSNNGYLDVSHNGNAVNLHLPPAQMVNNLQEQSFTREKNWLYQSLGRTASRDQTTWLTASRLYGKDSFNPSFVECESSTPLVKCCDCQDPPPEYTSSCDDYAYCSGVMPVDLNPPCPNPHQFSNVLTIPTNNALNTSARNNVLQPVSISSNNNLSQANVVGIPQHPRHGSVPHQTTPNRGGGAYAAPLHQRMVSEPTPLAAGNQFRFAPMLQHTIDPPQTVAQHFRSSSVPSSRTQKLSEPLKPIQNEALNSSMKNNQMFHSQINAFKLGSTSTASDAFRNVQVIPNISSPVRTIVHQNNSTAFDQSIPRMHHQVTPTSISTGPKNANNINNVNVNFYRAVPVNVVSSVPTIKCLNTLDVGNNVSNVQIMPCGGQTTTSCTVSASTVPTSTSFPSTTTQVTVHSSPRHSIQIPSNPNVSTVTSARSTTRTFTSTEAQTDDMITVCPVPQETADAREQRRRERREKRHNRRFNLQQRATGEISTQTQTNNDSSTNTQTQGELLPDILNSHLPPPYSTLPGHNAGVLQAPIPPPRMVPPHMVPPPSMIPGALLQQHSPGTVLQTVVSSLNNVVPSGLVPFPPGAVVQGQVPLMQGATPVAVPIPSPSGFRFSFPTGGFRRGRFSEEPPKGCCGFLNWKPGSLRWFIALIALVAVCCVLVGTALGAMRPAGRDHLTVSLLMIGVGIVLVTVSGVAWRLTSPDASPCRTVLGMGSTESVDVCPRRFVPRLPPSLGRPPHPYAAMLYPEFQYRPPPPTYQASMQEYRLRLLLLDRGNAQQMQNNPGGITGAVSPPPTYRSHAGSLLRAPMTVRRDANQSEYSFPPSYRSNSTNRPAGHLSNAAILHSREHSLTMSESNNGESLVNVVSILGSPDEDIALDNITLDSLKMEPSENDINPLKLMLKGGNDLDGNKDGNLVTIVQTSDQNPVIVTVSGCSTENNSTVQITELPSEMEILAHL